MVCFSHAFSHQNPLSILTNLVLPFGVRTMRFDRVNHTTWNVNSPSKTSFHCYGRSRAVSFQRQRMWASTR